MENVKKKFRNLQIFSFLSILFPLILLLTAKLMQKNGFTSIVEEYEKGAARIIQYILYFLGASIMFGGDTVSDFVAKKVFKERKTKNKETFPLYFTYTLSMIWFTNLIGISGFIGFLICGNFSWLGLFVLINIPLQIRYIPTYARYKKLCE